VAEPDFVSGLIRNDGHTPDEDAVPRTLDEIVDIRSRFLTAYQNAAYAQTYRDTVKAVSEAESKVVASAGALGDAVAHALFKLMAIKDEYEVARLYSDGHFLRELKAEFSGWDSLEFHLAPPLLARRDKNGRLKKKRFGPWMMRLFPLLASMRGLRGTVLDPFGYQEERRAERRLLQSYRDLTADVIARLSADNLEAAVQLLNYPVAIRGYGHVKAASIATAEEKRAGLQRIFDGDKAVLGKAAE